MPGADLISMSHSHSRTHTDNDEKKDEEKGAETENGGARLFATVIKKRS